MTRGPARAAGRTLRARRLSGPPSARPSSRRRGPAAALVAVCLLAALTPGAVRAQAEREPEGVLSAPLLLQHDCLAGGCESAGVGGALQLDLLHGLRAAPWLALGGTVGIGVVGGDADTTRVFVPLGASVVAGLFPSAARRVGFEARVRGGAWFGAGAWGTMSRADLSGGGFVSGGLHMALGLGSGDARARLRLTLGLDVIRLFGSEAVTLYAPGLALAWRSPPPETGAPSP